jgi:hypothetical protein
MLILRNTIMKNFMFFVGLVLAVAALAQQSQKNEPLWEPLNFLAGEWSGEGAGKPGQGIGDMAVTWDLGQHVLTIKGRSEYPATKDHPAFVHSSLMITYKDPSEQKLRATYFDSEGHVIQYAVEKSENPHTIRFVSEASPSSPRFRLTYTDTGDNALAVKFETAPPGKPDAFATYVEGKVRRK